MRHDELHAIFDEQQQLLREALDQCFLRLREQVDGGANSDCYEALVPTEHPRVPFEAELPDGLSKAKPSERDSVDEEPRLTKEGLYVKVDHGEELEPERHQSYLQDKEQECFEECFGGILPTTKNQGFLDLAIGILIVLNACTMLAEFEHAGLAIAHSNFTTGMLDDDREVFALIEIGFAIVFSLELILRLFVLRLEYFRSAFNIFDMLLVIVSMVSLLGLDSLLGIFNVSIIRLIRLARIMRSLRLLRTMKLFAGLRIMVSASMNVMPKVLWALCFLMVYILIGALVAGHLLTDFILDPKQDLQDREWVWQNYGTSYSAAYSMFVIVFSGGWPTRVTPILQKVSKWYLLLFLPVVIFIHFAALRVITGIIMKETIDITYEDTDIMRTKQLRAKKKQIARLKKIFSMTDKSHDGKVTIDELAAAMELPEVRACLSSWSLLPHEADVLFDLLDDGDGKIDWEEFLQSIMRLKGAAREADIIYIERELLQIKKLVQSLAGVDISSNVLPSRMRSHVQ